MGSRVARGMRFSLDFRVYPFLRKKWPGTPVFGYCPKLKNKHGNWTTGRGGATASWPRPATGRDQLSENLGSDQDESV